MNNNQQGFTLIELVVVIVILGILAATALPKFIDLSGDAQLAATKGVAGALGSAMAVNYAARKVNSTKGVAVTDCNSGATLLQGGMPSGYTVAASAVANDVTGSVTVTGPGTSHTANFTCMGIS